MMNRVLRFFSGEVRGMHEAAYLLALFSFGSQLLALVRDRLLAGTFGAGHTLDMYYAAFRVPDFIFATVASLFSLYALLPVLSRLEQRGEGQMASFLRDTLKFFFLAMIAVSAVAFVIAPWLAPLIAPGIATDPASAAQFVLLIRILLLQPMLLGASNTIAALTQLRHRFVLYSVSPLLYNVGIIFGALVLYPTLGMAGLGWGVVLGAALHLGIQLPYFIQEQRILGFKNKLPREETKASIREVLTLSVPRTLALSTSQMVLLVLTALASWFAHGSIAVFSFAFNLQAVPLTIIGVSYSVAAFPTLAKLFAEGKRAEFAAYVEAALRHILFWAVPATVFVIVLRAQLVRTILGSGAFDWDATRLTAAALALFIISLAAQSISMLIARAYYAAGHSKKPLYFAGADIVLSIGSALMFVWIFYESAFVRAFIESILRVEGIAGTNVLMLALGYTLGSVGKAIVGLWFFTRDFGINRAGITRLFFDSSAAALFGGFVAYETLSQLGPVAGLTTTFGVVMQGLVAGVVGLCATAGILALLKNRELTEAWGALLRRFRDVKPVVVEPSDVA